MALRVRVDRRAAARSPADRARLLRAARARVAEPDRPCLGGVDRPRAGVHVRSPGDCVGALQPAVRGAADRGVVRPDRSDAARGVCDPRRRPAADVSSRRAALVDRRHPGGHRPDVRAHDRGIRRRADGRRQSPRRHADGLDRDLRRCPGIRRRRGTPDGAAAPRVLVRGARVRVRVDAKALGGRASAMSLDVRLRTRLSPRFQLDVAFAAAPGTTIVFGASGSGKTTLLRSVAGLAPADEGRIAIDDRVLLDVAGRVDVPPPNRRVGFVFQHLALFPHLTTAANIASRLPPLPAAERQARTTAIAASFGIAHLLARRPSAISGGERQRVGLARALVTDPDVLLLDEPLSALDHDTQSRIIADLRRWNERRRIPILYVTHSQREAFALGERVLLLRDGSIVDDGTPDAVLNAPSHESVAQLAGFENLLDAVVVERRPGAGVMSVRLAGTATDLETPLTSSAVGDRIRVAIRAGDILIATEHPRGLSARNVLAGTIGRQARQGATVRLEVGIGVPVEVHVTPAASADLDLRPDRSVWLVIKTHSCHPVSAV